jgi:long-chain acyl-CoA synthetase
MESLKNVIIFEEKLTDEQKDLLEKANLKVYHFWDLIDQGKNLTNELDLPCKDDIYMLSYTSGTTGDPKGVKLSHKMVIGCSYNCQTRIVGKMSTDDCYLSYLPASHSFE